MNNQIDGDNTTPTENPSSDIELLKQKVHNFYLLKQPVHIKFKQGHFKNGLIKEERADFFILEEFQDGKEYIFFLEIAHIDFYKPPTQKGEENGN